MATTMTLLASYTAGSNQSQIDFNSIPQTYTDLVFYASIRSTLNAYWHTGCFRMNGISTNTYSNIRIGGNNGTAYSGGDNPSSSFISGLIGGQTTTANNFAPIIIYIPFYTSSASKTAQIKNGLPNNSTTDYYIVNWGNRNTTTSAITSISFLDPFSGTSIVTNSNFYLYGIKNS